MRLTSVLHDLLLNENPLHLEVLGVGASSSALASRHFAGVAAKESVENVEDLSELLQVDGAVELGLRSVFVPQRLLQK